LSILDIPTARVFVPLLQPARDKVAHGGRASGKSHFFAGLMVDDCLAEPGQSGGEGLRAVCIREIQKDLAQSAKLLIESKLSAHRLGEADGFKVYEDCIAAPGDGIIIFKGMNNYTSDSIKSLEGFKRSWWEEAHTATRKSISLLRPTLRASGSQMWWSYNRRFATDPVDAMFTGKETPTGCIVVQANWRDNPWRTAEIEQERLDCLRMNPDQYDHIWEGGYVSVAEGAYFAKPLAEAKQSGRIGHVAPDPLMEYRAFWDIGTRDATAIWVAQFVGREIRVLDYYEAVGQPLAAHLGWLRDKGYGSALCVLPHDGERADHLTADKFADHIQAAGFRTQTVKNQGKGAAMKRVEAARRLFPSIWFNEAPTEPGRAALGWYHEKRDEQRNIGLGPEHDWSSHGADAFGLMCVAYEEPREARKVRERHVAGGWMGR
jgi:phage terminase large subunit